MATVTETDAEVEDVLSDERSDRHYEVVDDLIVGEPPLGARETWIASRLVRGIIAFDIPGKLGNVVDEALFVLETSPKLRRRPDVAFISNERWPFDRPAPSESAWDVVPDLAVEIISPSDQSHNTMAKLEEYFRVGVRLVWVIYPEFRKVYAYDSTTSVRILKVGDDLEGGPVLPGFRYPVLGLFEVVEDGPPRIE
jgi:Uma2 family endonuclease